VLQSVRRRLQQPLGPDAIGAEAILHPGADAPFGQGKQRHADHDRGEHHDQLDEGGDEKHRHTGTRVPRATGYPVSRSVAYERPASSGISAAARSNASAAVPGRSEGEPPRSSPSAHQAARAMPGAGLAAKYRCTRPSRFTNVPSSSATFAIGSTTSASRARSGSTVPTYTSFPAVRTAMSGSSSTSTTAAVSAAASAAASSRWYPSSPAPRPFR